MPSSTGTELFTCTATRRLQGVEFRVKSAQIEEAMKLVSSNRKRRERDGATWPGGAEFYQLEMGANGIPTAFAGFSHGRFDQWGARELIFSRAPIYNLSLLLAVGLGSSDGVTITVPTVIPDPALGQYCDGLKAAVRQFYIDFLKESHRTIRITTEEIIS